MTVPLLQKRIKRLEEGCCPSHGKKMNGKASATQPHLFIFTCVNKLCDFEATSVASSGAPLTPVPRCMSLVDPTYAQLPQQTEEQLRGIMAADVAALALSRLAFVNRIETNVDIGTDFICELREKMEPTGLFFNAQCKVLPIQEAEKTGDISIAVRVSTARYWMIQPVAAILLVADPESGNIFWADAKSQLTARTDEWREHGEVSLTVLRASRFACFDPPPAAILNLTRGALGQLGTSLKERIYSEEKMLRAIQRIGYDGSPREVSTHLIEKGYALEVDALLVSVKDFQYQFQALLLHRIHAYCCALLPLLENETRMTKHLFGFDDAKFFNDLIVRVRDADAYCTQMKDSSAVMLLADLIKNLKSMEEVHMQWAFIHEENASEHLSQEIRHDVMNTI